MVTTPCDREILTHYYVCPLPFPRETDDLAERVAEFVRLGLLRVRSEPNVYGSNIEANHDALRVYMDALGKVPLPVQQWVIP